MLFKSSLPLSGHKQQRMRPCPGLAQAWHPASPQQTTAGCHLTATRRTETQEQVDSSRRLRPAGSRWRSHAATGSEAQRGYKTAPGSASPGVRPDPPAPHASSSLDPVALAPLGSCAAAGKDGLCGLGSGATSPSPAAGRAWLPGTRPPRVHSQGAAGLGGSLVCLDLHGPVRLSVCLSSLGLVRTPALASGPRLTAATRPAGTLLPSQALSRPRPTATASSVPGPQHRQPPSSRPALCVCRLLPGRAGNHLPPEASRLTAAGHVARAVYLGSLPPFPPESGLPH